MRALALRDRALVDVRLFRVTSFSAASGLLFLSGFALYGAMLLVPLYFQQTRGFTAFQAGLLIAAQGAGVLASRGIAGVLTDRIGARWVAFSAAYIGLDRTEIPHAGIITRTSQQIGGSVGTALLAVVLERALAGRAPTAAFNLAFWWSIGFTVAATVLALWLPTNATPDA